MKINRIVAIIFIFFLFATPSFALGHKKTIGEIEQNFTPSNIPEEIKINNKSEVVVNDLIIPQNSIITLKVLEAQQERRWHKSGFIVLNAQYYETDEGVCVDLTDEDLYLLVRKYEKVDPEEAMMIGTELVVSTAVSFIIPGIDIVYYFTKGAILREKHPNWFKAGVSNAYDNSIFWFGLKGKPIELKEDDTISLQTIDEERAQELTKQIGKRKAKKLKKLQRLQQKKKLKQEKKAQKEKKKREKKLKKSKKIKKQEQETEQETVKEALEEVTVPISTD